jgi:hypothetical protein
VFNFSLRTLEMSLGTFQTEMGNLSPRNPQFSPGFAAIWDKFAANLWTTLAAKCKRTNVSGAYQQVRLGFRKVHKCKKSCGGNFRLDLRPKRISGTSKQHP